MYTGYSGYSGYGGVFGEAERYVIRHWAASHEVELSLESVRGKYQQLCERVADEFLARHPQFDVRRVRVMHLAGGQRGMVAVSRRCWPRMGDMPAGLWLENLRLEVLADPEAPPPVAGIWIKPLEARGVKDLQAARVAIAAEATRCLGPELLRQREEAAGYALAYRFASKQELMEAIADGPRLSALLTRQLELLSRFTALLDRILPLPACA